MNKLSPLNLLNISRRLCAAICIVSLASAASVFAQNSPVCSGLKEIRKPLAGDFGGFGQIAFTRQSISDPRFPAEISIYLPAPATADRRAPVIFFAHAFNAISYQFYEDLLKQLASNGYAVVFVPYASNAPNHTARYNQLWTGFMLAVGQYAAVLDTAKIGVVGHSFGGGAVPEIARRAVAQGWGANGLFLMPLAPWFSWGANYNQIPATAKLLVQVYWDDETNDHLIAQNDIWHRLPQITERKWQVIRSSRNCVCRMIAGHAVPVTSGGNVETGGTTNAHDFWGVWRRIHALADYTFTGNQTARAVAFGDDSSDGEWRFCGARSPITLLESFDVPVVNTTNNHLFRWANRCLYAQGELCP